MKVRYSFVTGETVEIEVSDEMGNAIMEIEKKVELKDRAENRRHTSLDVVGELGHQIADPTADAYLQLVFKETAQEHRAELAKLQSAMRELQPQQQALIHKVYFEGHSMAEIARQEGVTNKAIQNRINRVLIQLKKYF